MKKSFFMLMILFICGFISADVCINIIKDSSALINLEMYKEYANASLVFKDVVWNILYERLKLFGFVFLLCFTPLRKRLGILLVSVFSFVWGFYIMSCILELGLAGVVIGIAAVFPQGLFYGVLIITMLRERSVHNYHYKGKIALNILSCMVMVLLFVTGCVMEGLISTHFIPWVIRLSQI